ncbi:hypothetical protein LIER_07675 [Lithospermum erythrorhizon]|uniref:Uncharacterized protein n=1 Tax=Lithospermum erythrorhizon TaxID=34254 RepID=A0AAV3P926_LITER
MSQDMPPLGTSLPPRKRMGSHLASSRPSQSLRRSERTPPASSSAVSNHAELISSLSTLGDKGVALQSYKEILSSYEDVSGSSSRVGQLEGELKALKKEKAREEGILQRHLKNLVGEHTTLQEKYVASVRRTEVVRAELEGVWAEKVFTVKERDHLRAGRDKMLQTHDRLLDQLTESQRQAQTMEATLEGTRALKGLGELVRGSDVGRDLFFQHSSQALERTIRAVQAKLEEADLEIPSTLWDLVRDDVSSPDPS